MASLENIGTLHKLYHFCYTCNDDKDWDSIMDTINAITDIYKSYKSTNISFNDKQKLPSHELKALKSVYLEKQFEWLSKALQDVYKCSIPELQVLLKDYAEEKMVLTNQEIAKMLKQLGWVPKTDGKQRWWAKDKTPLQTIDNMEI